jgi:parallel beta-helix repeat protein
VHDPARALIFHLGCDSHTTGGNMLDRVLGSVGSILGTAALATAFFGGSTGHAEAATIRVPADQASIQSAIAAAAPGDTVVVSAGVYAENIGFLGKPITVMSESGPDVTIIDGRQHDSVATFIAGEGPASILSGFTLRNGRSGFDTPGFGDGGGIRISSASPTIRDNVISGNRACAGVGVSVRFGSPLIQRNVITANQQDGCSGGVGGGGIALVGNATAQILDNTISDNVMLSASGGGISLFAAGTPTIRGNIIAGNMATGTSPCAKGGGIALVNVSDAVIAGNLIVGNSAACGGGLYWLVPSGARGPRLVNNTIADNDAATGSGVFADGFDAQAVLVNNIIVALPGQTAVYCGNFNDANAPIFRSNDIWSPGAAAYGGICAEQTGISGNISADPLFVDAAAGDYHLQSASPAIDAGDRFAPNLPTTDVDGEPRALDGGSGQAAVDMGADEFSIADLVAISVSDPPTSAELGGSFSVTDTVSNEGTGAVGSFTLRYYLSPDPMKGAGAIPLSGGRTSAGLAPGEASTGTATVTIPSSLPFGTYYLLACADADDELTEQNESNNCVSSMVVMKNEPDLVEVSVLNPPAMAEQGSSLHVTDTAKNAGSGTSRLSTTRYYLAPGPSKVGATLLGGTRSVPALTTGASSTGTVAVTVPLNAPLGRHYLLACADDTAQVTEQNEGNNCTASVSQVKVVKRRR